MGLFAGTETDGRELKVVQSSLKSLGVHVVQSAVDGAPQSDEVATNQQAALIAQRFQEAGVNEVIAVGTGATVWPESLQANESTYLPAWIATDESGLESAVLGSSIQPKYLENVLTTSPVPSNYTLWHTPAVQPCDQRGSQGVPLAQDHAADESTDRLGPDLLRSGIGLPEHRPVLDDRQGGGKEPDLVHVHPRRLRAQERRHSGIGCTGLLRARAGPTHSARCTS